MPEREDSGLRTRAEWGVMHILPLTDEANGFGNAMGHTAFSGTVVDHDKGPTNNEVVGDFGEKGSRIEQTQRQAPGEERFGCDERIPDCNDVGRMVVLSVVCDDILGMRQILNMALRVINATSPITIETMPVHLRPNQL